MPICVKRFYGWQDLSNASLENANLFRANLSEACLDYAQLAGANFKKTNLWHVNLGQLILAHPGNDRDAVTFDINSLNESSALN